MAVQSPQNPKRVIFDTDGGGDDLWALLLLIDAHKRGDIELLGVTTCFGNTSLENATNNILNFLYACGTNDISVMVGASKTLENRRGLADNAFGAYGLSQGKLPSGDFEGKDIMADEFINHILSNGEPISIISTGPLTNLAKVFRQNPDFDRGNVEILWMGGAVYPAGGDHQLIVKGDDENGNPIYNQGNITSKTEFNCANDVLAVQKIMALKKVQVTIFPMDVAQNTDFDNEWQNEFLEASSNCGMKAQAENLIAFLQDVIELDQIKQGMEGTPIYDMLTVLYYLNAHDDIYPQVVPLSDVQIVNKGNVTEEFVDACRNGMDFPQAIKILDNHGLMSVTPMARGNSNIGILPGAYTFTDNPDQEALDAYIAMGKRRKKAALTRVVNALANCNPNFS